MTQVWNPDPPSNITFPFFPTTQVKVLFVRKLATAVTEELLEKTFSQFGKLERVKKLKDYAFVHFEERDAAVKVRLLRLSVRPARCLEFSVSRFSHGKFSHRSGDGRDERKRAGGRGN